MCFILLLIWGVGAGNRQNDPKDERRRSQMAAARQVLERSTLMLLVSSKTSLRHPECIHSKENRDTVFCQMRRAMDLIHYVIKDGILAASQTDQRSSSSGGGGGSSSNRLQPPPSTMEWDTERGTASSCLRIFARLMESSRPRFSTSGILSTSKSTLKDISSTGRSIKNGTCDWHFHILKWPFVPLFSTCNRSTS